jgi:hypothetical protein
LQDARKLGHSDHGIGFHVVTNFHEYVAFDRKASKATYKDVTAYG